MRAVAGVRSALTYTQAEKIKDMERASTLSGAIEQIVNC